MRTFIALSLIIIISTLNGAFWHSILSPSTHTSKEYVEYIAYPEVKTEYLRYTTTETKVIYEERVIAVGDLEPFDSVGEFRQFILDNRISDKGDEGWICVDYALRMYALALRAGKIMFVETILYDNNTGHEVNSAWIRGEKWFGDPVAGTVGLIGKAGQVGEADPIKIILDPDWTKNQVGDLSWKE